MFIFLIFLVVIAVNYVTDLYFKDDILLQYSIVFLLLGIITIVGYLYFDLGIVSSKNGIKTEISDKDSAFFVGGFLIFFSLLSFLVSRIVRFKKNE